MCLYVYAHVYAVICGGQKNALDLLGTSVNVDWL